LIALTRTSTELGQSQLQIGHSQRNFLQESALLD